MPRERRFYVAALGPEIIELPAEEAHHLIHVLRLGEGAAVSVFDARGGAARAEVHRIAGSAVTLRVLGTEPSRESPLALALGVALVKGDRMALVVQKLTELGVHRILPLRAERSDVGAIRSARNLERWRRIALESCKQSGRSLAPRIDPPRELEDILEEEHDVRLLATPDASPLASLPPPRGSVLALVGPEGGWSEAERALARARGVVPFGLGPRTLRTETAAVAAAALLQCLGGDLGSR